MLHLQSFTFNPFQENTYLLYNDQQECWIIDPGMYGPDEEKILFDFIDEKQLKPQQIINTHAHIDHILGIAALQSTFRIPLGIHQQEQVILDNAKNSALMFGLHLTQVPKVDFYIEEGKLLQLGADQLQVRLAPGHSPGSILFYSAQGKWVISGDVLFQGSIGRSDLPGGDHETLLQSIRRQLYTLPNDTYVYSGHGGVTSIEVEKQSNPFVQA